MKRDKQVIVTKRDGSVERFSLAKLANCLAAALRGRAYDPHLSQPLTKAVAMHLRQWHGETPPTTEYVHRCVCSVLEQTGLGDVAADLLNQRRLRAARRRRVRVLAPGRPCSPGQRWCKGTVVEHLQNRYGLRYSVSRFLAGQIEAHVFALNYRVISETFLAELVRNEVLAWGLTDEPLRADVPANPQPVAAPQPEKEN